MYLQSTWKGTVDSNNMLKTTTKKIEGAIYYTALGCLWKSIEIATRKTQKALDRISDWYVKWKIAINADNSKGKTQKAQDCPYEDKRKNIPWKTELSKPGKHKKNFETTMTTVQ